MPREFAYFTPTEKQVYLALYDDNPAKAEEYRTNMESAYKFRSHTDWAARNETYYAVIREKRRS